jgi:hypothetical protein
MADRHRSDLAGIETVNLLNELALWAPSSLIGSPFRWREVDARHVEATFTNRPDTVRATLVFDLDGDQVDFVADERAQAQPDGTLERLRWSTQTCERRACQSRSNCWNLINI